jgi:hypothetical protein
MKEYSLLSPEEVIERLRVSVKLLQGLRPHLPYVTTPGGTARFPASYITAVTKYANNWRVTPTQVEAFARTAAACTIAKQAQQAWQDYIRRTAASTGYLHFGDIARLLRVEHRTIYNWTLGDEPRLRAYTDPNDSRYKVFKPSDLLNACKWHIPRDS